MDFRGPVADSNGIAYIPTIVGGGTHTQVSFRYWRKGSRIKVIGSGVSGTPTGVVVQFPLPTGLNVKSVGINASKILGSFHGNVTTTATSFPVTTRGPWVVTHDATIATNTVTVASASDLSGEESNSIFVHDLDNTAFGTSRGWSVEFECEVEEWQL